MGIPGLLREIGKGERISLCRLAVDFLERHGRPLRIAIDVAIWQFQNQAGQGGQNPALRTFYYRLVRLLALPIDPLFVYDGPNRNKPPQKRGKLLSSRWVGNGSGSGGGGGAGAGAGPGTGTRGVQDELSKRLLRLFRFPYRIAPAEAEAECALLQREEIVDAVMSEDVDALMWGSTMTIRDWSAEGTYGNKAPTHVNLLRSEETRRKSGLDPDGMILVALLSGGDYAPDGLPGFGLGLACEVARARFGTDLLEAVATRRKGDATLLTEWRERLQHELQTNESGYFKTRHPSVKVPASFPDDVILGYYLRPAVSSASDIQQLRAELSALWGGDIDVTELREYVGRTFNWNDRGGSFKLIRSLAPALLARRLIQRKDNGIQSSESIKERRTHFINGGVPELRVEVIPADIVALDIEAEIPDTADRQRSTLEQAVDADVDVDVELLEPDLAQAQSGVQPAAAQPRKTVPWDPFKLEKIWIPETILKLGAPTVVAEWEQRQRDMLSDPRSFIVLKSRKAKPSASATHQTRSINTYFKASKVTSSSQQRAATLPSSQNSGKDPSRLPSRLDPTPPNTPSRRRPQRSKPISPPPKVDINPFSIATSSQYPNKKPILPTSTDDSAISNPSRRKARPLQKSKTMPCSFELPQKQRKTGQDEETEVSIITISSSPLATPPVSRDLRATSAETRSRGNLEQRVNNSNDDHLQSGQWSSKRAKRLDSSDLVAPLPVRGRNETGNLTYSTVSASLAGIFESDSGEEKEEADQRTRTIVPSGSTMATEKGLEGQQEDNDDNIVVESAVTKTAPIQDPYFDREKVQRDLISPNHAPSSPSPSLSSSSSPSSSSLPPPPPPPDPHTSIPPTTTTRQSSSERPTRDRHRQHQPCKNNENTTRRRRRRRKREKLITIIPRDSLPGTWKELSSGTAATATTMSTTMTTMTTGTKMMVKTVGMRRGVGPAGVDGAGTDNVVAAAATSCTKDHCLCGGVDGGMVRRVDFVDLT